MKGRNPVGEERKVYCTRALLDSGSNRSFCTERLTQTLEIKGESVAITLDTLNGEDEGLTTEVDLEVTGKGMKWSRAVTLYNVIVKKRLPAALSTAVATKHDTRTWKHLQGIVPHRENEGVTIELLVGLDTPQALEPLEVRAGCDGAPFAVRTRLGWTVNGPVGYPRLGAITGCSLNSVSHKRDNQLESLVRRFWELETEVDKRRDNEDLALSIDDERVINLWSSTIRVVAGHYQLPIPFRKERPNLPDNRSMAVRRLGGLRRRLLKNSDLHDRYKREIQLLLDKGYAEVIPTAELESNSDYTWYLPHHPVLNPNKPDKLRIVLDCAATHDSMSLNSQVLQGPDLTNKLLGILLRFRRGRVALMADIEAMFHQIKVYPQHRDALRFLWWHDGDLTRKPLSYRMTVHPFGGVWSPSCAAFALQRTLADRKNEFPEASSIAAQGFYVDDLLISMDSTEKAKTAAQQLREMLASKGFRLTKWMSTHREVLASVPVNDRHSEVQEVELIHKDLPVERALGVRWDLQRDKFAIQVNIRNKPATKRGLLSTISSVYDPLGFVSPYLIRAKMIFQEECRRKMGWDEPLEKANLRSWENWQEDLKYLANFQIPRCYKREGRSQPQSVQLHHFCDASQRAFGTVSYLRIADECGVHCSFVFGKAKLAPLKQQTIPRLELCAAVLAARVDRCLRKELDMHINESVFWTDSTLVLQYISNTERRFRVFVANRITTIRALSHPSQWRHVTTTSNPADAATRGLSAQAIVETNKWIAGPDFLSLDESKWPVKLMTEELRDDPEIVSCSALSTTKSASDERERDYLNKLWTHYSSWHELQKGVAWILCVMDWLRNKRQPPRTSPRLKLTELQRARKLILLRVQQDQYREEAEDLSRGKPIMRNSKVYRLEPWLDEDSLLRVGGRMMHAPFGPTSKGPILLPRDHPVTDLITRDVHQNRAGHSGREHTMGLLRQQYWIPQFRRKLDKILKTCIVCRRNNWKMIYQRQAPLPKDRVTPGTKPFASTGVDCFGPFLIRQGRRQIKRWGCLFTCMATRAVHIETLESLDADAFLNALARFAARRGLPESIRSDNGTNLVRADKELKEAMRRWREDARVSDTLLQKQIEWTFNPPKASHMGGVWERQIRTVRKVLRAIVGTQVLDEARLNTLFCEAEEVVNSRPLTPVSEDPNDLGALTPNHILRVGAHTCPPIAGPLSEEQYRRRWKHVQFLADQFWKRWLKEYLPLLRQRSGNLKPYRNFKKGDLVIVTDEAIPRNQWKLGRVVYAEPGDDGLVRQVKVRTARKLLVRPANKLCFLEGLREREI